MPHYLRALAIPGLLLLAICCGQDFAAGGQAALGANVASAGADLQSLARSLARSTKEKAEVLKEPRPSTSAPLPPTFSAADDAVRSFERVAEASSSGNAAYDDVGVALQTLARGEPNLYRALLSDPTVREPLLDGEKAFATPIFATAESNAKAIDLATQIRTLATKYRSLTYLEPRDNPSAFRYWNADITTTHRFFAELKNLEDALQLRNEVPVPQQFSASILTQGIRFLSPRLTSDATPRRDAFVKALMNYAGETNEGRAYGMLRYFSIPGEANERLAIALGESFLASFCKPPVNSKITCLNAISILLSLYDADNPQDRAKVSAGKRMLDSSIARDRRLALIFAKAITSPAESAERQRTAVGEVLNRVPTMSMLSHQPEIALMQFNELQAMAYWFIKAGAKAPGRLAEVLSDESRSESRFVWLMVLTSAYGRAMELKDTDTALVAQRLVRKKFEEDSKDHGSDERIRNLASRVVIDMLELAAWVSANNVREGQRIKKTIKSSIEQQLGPRGLLDRDEPTDPACGLDTRLGDADTSDSRLQYLLAVRGFLQQLQFKWDTKNGRRVPPSAVYDALAIDARDLFRSPAFSNRSQSRRGEEGEAVQPLSPAQFMASWPEYRKAFGGNTTEIRKAATTIKCLLSRSEIETRLTADFSGKGAKERAELGNVLLQLLADGGTSTRGPSDLREGDFRLLQMASLLQAHSGLSAAAARSVFPTAEARDLVRESEIGMRSLKTRAASFKPSLMSSSGMAGAYGLDSLLQVAMAHPEEYARYAQLRQQSITTMAGVQKALQNDEAAVMYSNVGDTMLAVVVRHDQARLVPLAMPVKTVQSRKDELLKSLRLPNGGAQPFPSPFRADSAWALYKGVFEPLEGSLSGATTVYLIGGDVLSGIPFQALLGERPPSQAQIDFSSYRKLGWLGDKYAFVSLPSAHSMLKVAEGRNKAGAARLFSVGEPTIPVAVLREMGLEGTPDTASLLKRVGKVGDPEPLLRARATVAALAEVSQSGTLGEDDIVLINAHTVSAAKAERFGSRDPAILLAHSGKGLMAQADLLNPAAVLELRLSVRLMILLACETAGGDSADRDQAFAGLVNAFFFAGAETVLATAQPVHSAMAEDFAASFLSHVRDKQLSSAKALQRATAEVRCVDNDSSCAAGANFVRGHPAYWSQFMLVGSAR